MKKLLAKKLYFLLCDIQWYIDKAVNYLCDYAEIDLGE